jgi:general receptor for phosphoinositides 1-associated scaffold protein
MHKPKSWDNLAAKGFGGYGFGYGYLDSTSVVIPNNKTFVTIHHRHSIPRKTVNTYHNANFNSIIPPPSQFIQETTTTMTTITTNHLQQSTKSTENLIGAYNLSDSSCECIGGAVPGTVVNRGYYSNLSRNPSNVSCGSRGGGGGVGGTAQTVSEVTKL